MAVGEVVIDLLERDQALSLISASLSAPSPLAVISANLQHIHEFAHSADPRCGPSKVDDSQESIRWLTLLDGVPLIRKASTLTGRKWPRLAGSELLAPLLERAADADASVGFLGGSQDTQRQLLSVLADRFPTLHVAGTWAPDRTDLEDSAASEEIARSIRRARVDLLVVSLGKPLQEEWIAHHGLTTGSRVFLAFGAATDFLAGQIRRSPRFLSVVGMEWAWRLALEPRRLWRRYLLDCPPAWLRVRRSAFLRPSSDDR